MGILGMIVWSDRRSDREAGDAGRDPGGTIVTMVLGIVGHCSAVLSRVSYMVANESAASSWRSSAPCSYC
jgi:hypothetical protein